MIRCVGRLATTGFILWGRIITSRGGVQIYRTCTAAVNIHHRKCIHTLKKTSIPWDTGRLLNLGRPSLGFGISSGQQVRSYNGWEHEPPRRLGKLLVDILLLFRKEKEPPGYKKPPPSDDSNPKDKKFHIFVEQIVGRIFVAILALVIGVPTAMVSGLAGSIFLECGRWSLSRCLWPPNKDTDTPWYVDIPLRCGEAVLAVAVAGLGLACFAFTAVLSAGILYYVTPPALVLAGAFLAVYALQHYWGAALLEILFMIFGPP